MKVRFKRDAMVVINRGVQEAAVSGRQIEKRRPETAAPCRQAHQLPNVRYGEIFVAWRVTLGQGSLLIISGEGKICVHSVGET